MPNIKSAKKRLRSSVKRRAVNQPLKTRVKTSRRAFLEKIAAGDREGSTQAYRQFCSSLDKAAKRGVIKKNNAVRNKSRAAAKLRALAATA
jgi:small subunit ribosomal protein S20